MRSAALAVLAIAHRDLRGVARSRAQLYSSIFTPILFLVFLGVGVSEGLDPTTLSDGNFTAYLVGGVVVMTGVFSSTFSSASYYRDRESGLLRVLLASPQSPRVVLGGKALAGMTIGALQAMAVLLAAAPFVDFQWQFGIPAGVAVSFVVVALLNVMLAGAGQAMSTRIESMQGFHLVMNLVLFPLLFFSGAFFPLDKLPLWLKIMAWANPLSYAVDGIQQAAYASTSHGYIGLPIDLPVLVGLAVVLVAVSTSRLPRLTWSGR